MNLTRRSLLIGGGAFVGTAAIAVRDPAAKLIGALGDTTPSVSRDARVTVRHFGALGNGRSDDREAIQRAIDAVSAAGGGTVELPSGTYMVGRSRAGPFALQLRSGVHLEGQGTAAIIKLADHASADGGAHTVYVDRAENAAVTNLVLDGNRQNQEDSGHCFKSDGVDGLRLENLTVQNAFSYGLGFQDGLNRRINIQRVLVQDTGADGIDFKNKRSGNAQIELNDVKVRRWGLRAGLRVQAAIDCRGAIRMSNIAIREPASDTAVGVRMRQGEIGDANGLGGHHSHLTGFDIRMGGGNAQIGVNVVARHVKLADGSVSGGARGMMIQGPLFRGSRIRVSDCADIGILLDAAGSQFNGNAAVLQRCSSLRSGDDGIQVAADDVELLDCVSVGSGDFGLLISDTAARTRVVGGDYSGNRRAGIADRGKNSRIAVTPS